MLKDNIKGDSQMRWIYRLLFLLFLAVFAQSPIADAYQDNFCSSSVFFNDLNDADSPVSIDDLKLNDAVKSLHALKLAFKQTHDICTLSLHALATDDPAGHFIKREVPLRAKKSTQICLPLSSDPSPPLI